MHLKVQHGSCRDSIGEQKLGLNIASVDLYKFQSIGDGFGCEGWLS